MNKKIIASFLLVAMLFVSAVAGTIVYYNNKLENLTSQISILKYQITNLTTANLVTSLGATEILGNSIYNYGTQPYNHLYVSGEVNNTGQGTAYNVGLHIAAYDATGILKINKTVPLGYGAFGTDIATEAQASGLGVGNQQYFGLLYSGQMNSVDVAIYHEGNVTNWTITPVWTNSP